MKLDDLRIAVVGTVHLPDETLVTPVRALHVRQVADVQRGRGFCSRR